MKLSEAQALAEQAIYDYTSSTKWQEVKYMNWTTAEMQDVIAKALVKNINVIQCCVNKDLDKHPIEGVNDFMLTDQEIEDTQFYCAGVEAGNRICESQCLGCCGFQRSYEQ